MLFLGIVSKGCYVMIIPCWSLSGCGCLFLRWWSPLTVWVGPLIFLSTTTWDVWIIPSFQIWGYMLHVEHVSCVITNHGQHQWVIPSPSLNSSLCMLEENVIRKLLSLSLELFFKILLFQVAFLIFFFKAIFLFNFFWLVGCFVIAVCGFISVRELVKYSCLCKLM